MAKNHVDDLVSRLLNRIENLEMSIAFKNKQILLLQTRVIRLKGALKDAVKRVHGECQENGKS